MRKLNIYKRINNDLVLVDSVLVRKSFEDSFYHRYIEKLSKQVSNSIIRKLNNGKLYDYEPVVFEWDDTKYRASGRICKNGTILNF